MIPCMPTITIKMQLLDAHCKAPNMYCIYIYTRIISLQRYYLFFATTEVILKTLFFNMGGKA